MSWSATAQRKKTQVRAQCARKRTFAHSISFGKPYKVHVAHTSQTHSIADPPHDAAPSEQPLAYRAVRGGLWVMLSSYWMVGAGFVANIVLTRLLDPEAFGVFALAMFFAQLFRLQPKLALGQAFAQHKEITGEALGTYVVMELLTIGIGILLTILAAPVLVYFGYATLVVQVSLALALAAALEGLVAMSNILLEKEFLFGPISLLQSILFPLSYIPAFWLAYTTGSVWSIVIQNATYYLCLLIGTLWLVYHQAGHIWRTHWSVHLTLARHFLSFGCTVGLGLLATMLLTQLDNFYIGTFAGLTMLGFYDRAYRTAQWSGTLMSSLIARTAFYTYARLQDDRVRLQKSVTMMVWLINILAFPLALALFVVAPDLIALLYGERWLPATLFLRVLALYSIVRPLWENASTFFVAIGKPRQSTFFMLVQVIILAVAGIPFTLSWGAIGTCVAVGLAFAVGLLLIARTMRQEIALNLIQMLAIPILISVIVIAGYFLLSRLTPLNELPLLLRLGLKGAYVGVAFYGLMLLLQPHATREHIGYIWRLVRQDKRDPQ